MKRGRRRRRRGGHDLNAVVKKVNTNVIRVMISQPHTLNSKHLQPLN